MTRPLYNPQTTPTPPPGTDPVPPTPGTDPVPPPPAPGPDPMPCAPEVENPNCYGTLHLCPVEQPGNGDEPTTPPGGYPGWCWSPMPYPMPYPYPCPPHHGHMPRYPMKGEIKLRCEHECQWPCYADAYEIISNAVGREELIAAVVGVLSAIPNARYTDLVDLGQEGWILVYKVPV